MDTIDTMEISMITQDKGLDKRRYNGLDILNSTASLRPVQITRQFVSLYGQTTYPQYGAYEGLGYKGLGPAKTAGNQEDTLIPITLYTNPIGNTHNTFDMKVLNISSNKGLGILDYEGLVWYA